MMDPFITAINSEKSALTWFEHLAENVGNIYTPGFRERKTLFSDFLYGSLYNEMPHSTDQGKSIPGRAPSNLFIEGKGYFALRQNDGNLLYTRLGDFKFDSSGTLINDLGQKVQGFLTDEKGNVINTAVNPFAKTMTPNTPSHVTGGPGHLPTTEINLWVDPSNGKFLGKYDEWKIKPDGTLVGVANAGKTITPLYKVAVVNFPNAGALAMTTENYYVPTKESGDPMEGTGEVQSGLLESSNVSLRENVNYLQQAKLQIEVTQKLITTNKNLLQESLRLTQ
jgi:flagellar hook protein FlgE